MTSFAVEGEYKHVYMSFSSIAVKQFIKQWLKVEKTTWMILVLNKCHETERMLTKVENEMYVLLVKWQGYFIIYKVI